MTATDETIYLQDRRGEAFGLPTGPVTAVAVDADGWVWAGTPSGLFVGQPRDYEIHFTPHRWAANSIEALLSSPDGVWAVSQGSLLQFDADDLISAPRHSFDVEANPLGMTYADGSPWILYKDALIRARNDALELVETPGDVSARQVAFGPDGRLWLATDGGIWSPQGEFWGAIQTGNSPLPSDDVRDLAFDAHRHLWMATENGVVACDGKRFWETLTPDDGLPLPDVRSLLLAADGAQWFVLGRGLARFQNGVWRYFGGRRWLPSDTVNQIAPDGQGGVFAATPDGLGWIAAEPMTLGEKARRFHERLRERHSRHGFVAPCILQTPGDPASFIHEAQDNDGLWTSLYVAAECFRYQATGAEDAKAYAKESMDALERLEQVTPISGFPARAMVFAGERVVKSDAERGEWHPFSVQSPRSKVQGRASRALTLDFGPWTLDLSEGEWKGDTSSDELDGHLFACAVFWETFDDPAWRAQVAAYAGRIADHLIRNDFCLIDLDGEHTRWGFYSPKILNTDQGAAQRGLNSLEILSILKTAHHLTGEARFQDAYLHLVRDHHYALNVVKQKVTTPGHVNHSDDELAFLAYYGLCRFETDPDLLALYRWSLRRSWEIERPERSPFFNFLYGVAMGTRAVDADVSCQALEEIPLDIISWTMENSHRADLPVDEDFGRFREPQSQVSLSPAERGMLKWNGNPYRLDGGSGGREEEDGAFFLLPYWMGRAFGFL